MVPASTVFGLTRAEVVSLKEAAGSGLTVTDSDTRNEGYEVREDLILKDTKPRPNLGKTLSVLLQVKGASPFKVMRLLCSKFGWETEGEPVSNLYSAKEIISLHCR